jgi:LysM repeat protein
MKSNSMAFAKYATELKTKPTQAKPTTSKPKPFKTGVDWMDNALKGDTYIHVVKPGDTLLAIALKHGLTLDLIMGMNGLTNDDIVPGQKIKIK